MPLAFSGPATRLSPEQIASAAATVGLTAALAQAVFTVESGGKGGYLPDTRPVILFEAQKFHAHTACKYDAAHPDISSPTWNRALYSHTREGEYDRLNKAALLDRAAALQSASWGMFQILGENFAACGFSNVEDFVSAMVASEAAQLQAFLAFVKHEGMLPLLAAKNWAAFARRYNGPLYEQNAYDRKLAKAYAAACVPSDPVAIPKVLKTSVALNVRTGPGVSSPLVAGSPLEAGHVVALLQKGAGGWVQVSYVLTNGNASGWVNGAYLA